MSALNSPLNAAPYLLLRNQYSIVCFWKLHWVSPNCIIAGVVTTWLRWFPIILMSVNLHEGLDLSRRVKGNFQEARTHCTEHIVLIMAHDMLEVYRKDICESPSKLLSQVCMDLTCKLIHISILAHKNRCRTEGLHGWRRGRGKLEIYL